jgi:hypothetical protein
MMNQVLYKLPIAKWFRMKNSQDYLGVLFCLWAIAIVDGMSDSLLGKEGSAGFFPNRTYDNCGSVPAVLRSCEPQPTKS